LIPDGRVLVRASCGRRRLGTRCCGGKGEAPLTQIAKDFGICEACLHRWLKLADVEVGIRPNMLQS
jgi:hypothetical protein